jgi:hypothetical protein
LHGDDFALHLIELGPRPAVGDMVEGVERQALFSHTSSRALCSPHGNLWRGD